MEEKEILSKVAETLVDKPLDIIKFTIYPKKTLSFMDRVLIKTGLKKGVQPKELSYTLRPILVGNRVRIASRSVKIPKDILKGGISAAIRNFSHLYNDDFIYITAVAIQNDRDEPSEELIEELKWLDDKTLAMYLDKALSYIDVEAFIKSIILIMGSDILSKVSPED